MANLRDIDSVATGNSAATQIDLTSNQIRLRTGSTERARVDSTGFVVSNGNILLSRSGVSTDAQVLVRADAGNNRAILFQTGSSFRWAIQANNAAESGSNAGSNLSFTRYNDAGAFIDTPLFLVRSTGIVNVASGLAVTASTASTSTTTGALVVTGGVGVGGAVNTGGSITSRPGALGTLVNNEVVVATGVVTNTNSDNLITRQLRLSAGSDWQTAAWDIRRRVDVTDMGFIRFGGATTHRIALGVGTTEGLVVTAASTTITTNAVVLPVQTGIGAAGTTQAAATALSRSISVVSSSTAGSATGVRLPATPDAGTVMTVINTTANTINVFPATGGTIDTLSANAAFPLGSGGKLQFVATTTTQWYALTAVYA